MPAPDASSRERPSSGTIDGVRCGPGAARRPIASGGARGAAGTNHHRPRQLNYLLDEDEDPPGPLDAAEPPPEPPLLDAAPPPEDEPDMPPPLDAPLPPAPDPAVLPALVLVSAGAVVDEDEDDPPGTTTVSRSFVVVDEVAPLGVVVEPPGTTVVVSFRSHADSANAPNTTKR
jgi:hypothetical protein